jgi:predicted nuclease of restriction endonuclease-like RecB superfamily
VKPIDPDAAIERYNLGLAQAVLLRATRVTVKVSGEKPARYRRLFRAARFHQLMHVVRREDDAYVVELDGPFSLFDSVQRYGLKLALFLPNVLAFSAFHVRADVLWGKERTPLVFEIGPDDGLGATAVDDRDDDDEVDLFRAAFERLGSPWKVRRSDRVFALPGEVACIPDLVFEHGETGELVYLEVFGFWSRAAVWQRVELLRKRSFPARVLLAVGKQLRVSEEVLGEGDAGEVYVYARTLSPRAVLERLERLDGRSA